MAMREQPNVITATFPNEVSYVPVAQALVREAAIKVGFEGTPLSEIEVAVEEAVSNIANHAYDAEENSTFDIVCELGPSSLTVVLKERGIPFDPGNIPAYKPGQALDDASTAGIGVFLMRSMVDECSFLNLGPGGKETRLVKYLPKSERSASEASQGTVTVAEPQVIQERLQYQVRLMRDQEAIEVSKCAYKSHGYSFFDDHIYYPERLVELNGTGEMISVVAVTSNEVFMGHACLLFQYPEDRCAELTFVFVNPEYRSQGAFGRLLEYLFATESKRPLDGVYAYAVANHPFTQKAVIRQGILDCGILLATSPASWKFKGIPGDPSQRISVVLSFRYIGEAKPLQLFLPPQHREMIAKLYKNIGANHEFTTPKVPVNLSGDSEIKSGTNASEGCAEIFVCRYGKDIVREVKKLLRGFCLQQYAAINLFLNMEDPATSHACAEFEKLGFFFAGILPLARLGDALILQYLNNVDLDYSKITAHSDVAKEVLEYIRKHDPNVDA